MIDKLLNLINESYPLKKRELADFKSFDLNGMQINVSSFDAQNLGTVSIIEGHNQMMKLDTLMIMPFEKDLNLFSYDRICTFGNDNILIELYDVLLNKDERQDKLIKSIGDILIEYQDIENHDHEPKWYDDILLPVSIDRKGGKELSTRFNKLAYDYLNEYLANSLSFSKCDSKQKKIMIKNYCDNLLNNGGASTDVFVKAKGKEFCKELFHKALFNV